MNKENNKLQNRYYGITGVEVTNGMFNCDFDHLPPTSYEGIFRASGFALKNANKEYMKNADQPVLGLRRLKIMKDGKACPKTIDENFTDLTGLNVTKTTKSKELLKDLFRLVDVKQYGVTFPIENNKVSITGAVQYTDGLNLDSKTEVKEDTIGTPYQNSKKDKTQSTSLGNRIILDNALFAFSFSLLPNSYKDYEILLDGFDGFTKDDFELFKKSNLYGVSQLNSVAKVGCANSFAIFIKCKENTYPTMANLHKYVSYERGEVDGVLLTGKLDITKLIKYLSYDDLYLKVEDIEIYLNPMVLSVVANINGEEITINNDNSYIIFDGEFPIKFHAMS